MHFQRARPPNWRAAWPSRAALLDEIHKVTDWYETVKHLWDEDTRLRVPLKVVLLGSAPLLVARGSNESLAGRAAEVRW